ncbi:MAG: tRNA pseudouridine(55) synthase TruB [Bifidobacteriaceae bacterium]|jgi:tRNA pseudouridine55 synthase|nr:tRNA pseudouridine(55) synthase TruB [Bifidobacteriaceae bacterium]MCI1915526.1 tRNA pseudouridine(55) synthase TruB [Bifidobacteriaceae bacterium]
MRSDESRLPVAGFLLIDKPKGVTSHDVVAAARGALHMRRVGHAGTLDPLATGLLVVGFGAATRLLNYVVGKTKTYEAVIRLGVATTTDDAEGESVGLPQSEEVLRRLSQLTTAVDRGDFGFLDSLVRDHFSGTIDQVPSTFSAIKVNGERAYDLARAGDDVHLASRKVTISGFDRLGAQPVTDADGSRYLDLTVRISCSAGTYIRAIARDLGKLLGVGGYLTYLRRTTIGGFDVKQAVTATTVEKTFTDKTGVVQRRLKVHLDAQEVAAACIDAGSAVSSVMPTIELNPQQYSDVQFGRQLEVSVAGPTAALYRATAKGAADEAGSAEAASVVLLCAIVEPSEREGWAQPTAVFPPENRD